MLLLQVELIVENVGSAKELVAVPGEPFVARPLSVDETAKRLLLLPPGVQVLAFPAPVLPANAPI